MNENKELPWRPEPERPRGVLVPEVERKDGDGECLHRNVDKGNDEYTPDRCRDCFVAVYPDRISY